MVRVYRCFVTVLVSVVLSTLWPAAAGAFTTSYSEIVDLNTNGASCLEVANGSTANGATVRQWGCSGGSQQLWELVSTSTAGYEEVVNQKSGKCLDVTGGSKTNGANVQQWACSGAANELWHPVPSDGAYYSLINLNSASCLDVANAATANGANVQQWGCWDTSGQQWNGTSVASAYTNATTSTGNLIFDDEFNGPGGSQPGAPWTILTGSQLWSGQCEVNDTGHVVEGFGVLVLKATYNPGGTHCGTTYESGALYVPATTWNYKYGTALARLQVPCQSGTGVWPAWWQFESAYGIGNNSGGEIDSIEVLDNHSPPGENAEQSLHNGTSSLNVSAPYLNPIGQNWCNNFHVFGNVWRPGEVDFTVDGAITARYFASQQSAWPFDTYSEAPALSLLIGGYGGWPNWNTFPQQMLVDWVRIWQ
jgi:hypothetical protein